MSPSDLDSLLSKRCETCGKPTLQARNCIQCELAWDTLAEAHAADLAQRANLVIKVLLFLLPLGTILYLAFRG